MHVLNGKCLWPSVLPTDWLRYLVNPLMDKAIGVTTTYPIYEPIENSNIWSKIKKH